MRSGSAVFSSSPVNIVFSTANYKLENENCIQLQQRIGIVPTIAKCDKILIFCHITLDKATSRKYSYSKSNSKRLDFYIPNMVKVTLKEIAQSCGVSIFTVSSALAGNKCVAEKTSMRIIECAKKLGYRRNAAASRIRRGCCETIALIIDNLHPDHHNSNADFNDSSALKDWLCGVAVRSRELGFDLKLLPVNEYNFNGEDLKQSLGYPEADGVIFFGMDYQQSLYKTVAECGIPHIAIKPRCKGVKVNAKVDVDSIPAVRSAVRHLIEKGHKKIAYCSAVGLDEEWLHERYSGYEEVMKEYGLFDKSLFKLVNTRFDIRRLAEQFAKTREVTALVCHNDINAKCWLDELTYCGCRVPEDFAVIGYDANSNLPELSTVDSKGFQMAQLAVDLLVDGIKNKTPVNSRNVTAEFLPRKTT